MGGEIRKPRKSIFLKIGHRNSSIKVRKLWFLLNKLQLNLTHFKRNQTLLSLIELFLWPIFSKIDLRGFRISAPTKKKNCPNLKKKLSEQSTQFKLQNELLRNFIALLATEINGSEAVFLGRISTFFNF